MAVADAAGAMTRILFATAMLLGSTVGIVAAGIDSDYRSYFDAKPSVTEGAKPKGSQNKSLSVREIDRRRLDDDLAIRTVKPLKPGYRNQTGIDVPPDYSSPPRERGYDGFGSSARSGSYGSANAPNPFTGSLGTRRSRPAAGASQLFRRYRQVGTRKARPRAMERVLRIDVRDPGGLEAGSPLDRS